MEAMTKRMIEHGVKPEVAIKKSRETAIRADKRKDRKN